jgi:hypothetical protein
MTNFLFGLAPFALATAVFVGVGAGQEDTERVSRTVPISPGGTLHLKSFSGRVDITGIDRSDVSIDATRRAPKDRLARIKLDIHGSGDAVYVDANKRDASWWRRHNDVVETDFDIKVPRRTSVEVNVFSAAVSVIGIEGSRNMGGFSSRIFLQDGSGPINVHTFSGPVEIEAKQWPDGQNVDINTFSGNVTLRVPETVRSTLTFNSFSGHLNSEVPMTLRDGTRRAVKAELGQNPTAGGSLRFKTFSGSVRIER